MHENSTSGSRRTADDANVQVVLQARGVYTMVYTASAAGDLAPALVGRADGVPGDAGGAIAPAAGPLGAAEAAAGPAGAPRLLVDTMVCFQVVSMTPANKVLAYRLELKQFRLPVQVQFFRVR